MEQIEKSEIVIAGILNKALEYGLQQNDLRFEELELDSEFLPFFATCVDWLISEGLIRVGNHQKMAAGTSFVINISLTSYGFAVLGRKLTIGGEEMEIGQAVKKVASTGSGYSSAGDFFGGLLGGFTKSISS